VRRWWSASWSLAVIVSVAWIAACLLASWVIIRRRDFAGAPIGRRQGWGTPVRAVAASRSSSRCSRSFVIYGCFEP
jgi:hypothetical protein